MKSRQTPPKSNPRLRLGLVAALLTLCLAILLTFVAHDSSAQGQVQVNAADPATTEQGTVSLNVKVTGKGFKNGAQAKWFVTGTTNPGGVTVNSTTFVSSTELRANITVADDAVIANYDIQVLNSDGRGGKGTELFGVTPKGGGNASCPAMQPAPTTDTKCYGALPGCLDSTFGSLGFVHINPGSGVAAPQSIAVQEDGKIVVGGKAYFGGVGSDWAIIRYNLDGALDTSFGDIDPFNPALRRGYTISALSASSDLIRRLILQPDGKIIVVGSRAGDQRNVVVRYNSNGTLDSTFGSGGIATLPTYVQLDVALQSDGKILIGGNSNHLFSVWRLNTNGSLDSSFGSSGQVEANASGSTKRGQLSIGWAIAVQRVPAVTGEERIVLTGYSTPTNSNGNPSVWTTMRFRSNGATDTTFGTSGIVRTPFAGFGDMARTVTIDSNNRILVAGFIRSYDSSCGFYIKDAAVIRYTQDGALDSSFGGGKQVIDVYGGADEIRGFALQPDGKILVFVSTESSDAVVDHAALIRFNPDGSRDSSFGLLGNGIVTFDAYGLNDTFGYEYSNLGLSPIDGKIVVAGSAPLVIGTPEEIFVARYLP